MIMENEKKVPEISDEDLKKFIDDVITQQLLEQYEDKILEILKYTQDQYPCEGNDKDWLDYSNFFCEKRANRIKRSCDKFVS